jgi:hypothetical protein
MHHALAKIKAGSPSKWSRGDFGIAAIAVVYVGVSPKRSGTPRRMKIRCHAICSGAQHCLQTLTLTSDQEACGSFNERYGGESPALHGA